MTDARWPRNLDEVMETTIDVGALRKLPKYVGRYTPSSRYGNACYLDAPGYPTYFTRYVYTDEGSNPPSGDILVITHNTVSYIVRRESSWEEGDAVLRSLWIPPSFDSPRVQAWLDHVFIYTRNCYRHPTEKEYGKPKMVIYPVPFYELRRFRDDPRFNDEWRENERRNVEEYNKAVIDERASGAMPENHLGVHMVREFYPDVDIAQLIQRIENPPTHRGDWYKYYEEQPDPEHCPGEQWKAHPVNDTWCQFCGWKSVDNEGAQHNTKP